MTGFQDNRLFWRYGHFATLTEVINHSNAHFKLELTEKVIDDRAHYLKSL